jgi:hypothetical protein
MTVPNEQEYFAIFNRIQDMMRYSCEELQALNGAIVAGLSERNAAEISSRIVKLAKALERVCNSIDDPAPADLPNEHDNQILAVGIS